MHKHQRALTLAAQLIAQPGPIDFSELQARSLVSRLDALFQPSLLDRVDLRRDDAETFGAHIASALRELAGQRAGAAESGKAPGQAEQIPPMAIVCEQAG